MALNPTTAARPRSQLSRQTTLSREKKERRRRTASGRIPCTMLAAMLHPAILSLVAALLAGCALSPSGPSPHPVSAPPSAHLLTDSREVGAGRSDGAELLPRDPALVAGTLENGLTYLVKRHPNPAGRAA